MYEIKFATGTYQVHAHPYYILPLYTIRQSYGILSKNSYVLSTLAMVSSNLPTTIPLRLTSTSSRPDIVTISDHSVIILDLTILQNTPFLVMNAKRRKSHKYGEVINNIQANHQNLTVSYHNIISNSYPRSLSKVNIVGHPHRVQIFPIV